MVLESYMSLFLRVAINIIGFWYIRGTVTKYINDTLVSERGFVMCKHLVK